MDRPIEGVAVTTRRNLAAWASGFLGILIGIVVGAAWQGSPPESLSSGQLAVALGVHHWRYTVPANAESQELTFELRDDDGVKTSGSATGWKPGETITVTVRPLMESKKLECSIVGKNQHGRFLLDNPFASLSPLHYADDGTLVNGVPLIKGNRKGAVSIVPASRSEPGDVSLWVVMEGRTTAKSD